MLLARCEGSLEAKGLALNISKHVFKRNIEGGSTGKGIDEGAFSGLKWQMCGSNYADPRTTLKPMESPHTFEILFGWFEGPGIHIFVPLVPFRETTPWVCLSQGKLIHCLKVMVASWG